MKISSYLLALPASAILKIVPFSSLSRVEAGRFALWQEKPIFLLDLHQLLCPPEAQTATHLANSCHSAKFAVIAHSKTTDRFAVPVDELPMVQEISLSNVQTLSAHHYRLMGGIAKHIVVSTYRGTNATLLLLDLQHALYRFQIANHVP